MLQRYAAPRGDTNPAAHALLSRFGTLDGVFSAPESELKKVSGVGDAAAQLIRLVPQVARRCLMSRSAQIEILDTTSKCGQYLLPYFHGESEEVVYLLCLDAKCKALDCVLIHRGGVNVASIAARKVVKAALDANATSVVLSHNHPSGLALPSPEDRQTTLVLKAALEAVGIVLADHIIVADDDFVSLRDDGILEDRMNFKLHSQFKPIGDQPQAIEKLTQGLNMGLSDQVLLGVTGSGKTFTMANIIANVNRPTLVLAHNKTLAAQLCSRFHRVFSGKHGAEYFISYYDYYQPEAYIAQTDTYIEKDSAINDEIERLRHSATSALSERRDVIVVSSVSCIYGLGDPIDYKNMVISLRPGMQNTTGMNLCAS